MTCGWLRKSLTAAPAVEVISLDIRLFRSIQRRSLAARRSVSRSLFPTLSLFIRDRLLQQPASQGAIMRETLKTLLSRFLMLAAIGMLAAGPIGCSSEADKKTEEAEAAAEGGEDHAAGYPSGEETTPSEPGAEETKDTAAEGGEEKAE
jgi:hypothetical protein